MGIPPFSHIGRSLGLIGTALALYGVGSSVQADEAPAPQSPAGATASKLQVKDAADKFSIDADHVEVRSLLMMIFTKVKAQFTVNNNVAGQVTLSLRDQSLPTTLDAVCKQLLLRYHKDANGIYVFEQDPAAIKAAITHIQDLNAQLRQQLRALGLSVPEDSLLDSVKKSAEGPGTAPGAVGDRGERGAGGPGGGSTGLQGGRGGGFGGGAPNLKVDNRPSSVDSAQTPRRTLQSPGFSRNGTQRNSLSKSDGSQKDETKVNLDFLTQKDLEAILGLNAQNNALQNPDAYRALMQQSGMVFINTGGQKVPVREVLQELGRQANTLFLIDPSVPSGPKFSIAGYITPRTLPEALNMLTQSSRLTWRWQGDSVYVAAMPDFQIFFNSTEPRVIFGYTPVPQVQQNLGQQAPSQQFNNGQGGGYAQPSQTPLPITNGTKKTP